MTSGEELRYAIEKYLKDHTLTDLLEQITQIYKEYIEKQYETEE